FVTTRLPPWSPLLPYTTLFRSLGVDIPQVDCIRVASRLHTDPVKNQVRVRQRESEFLKNTLNQRSPALHHVAYRRDHGRHELFVLGLQNLFDSRSSPLHTGCTRTSRPDTSALDEVSDEVFQDRTSSVREHYRDSVIPGTDHATRSEGRQLALHCSLVEG